MTGIKEPHINALKYSIGPILHALSLSKEKTPRLEVYCYQDLASHIEHNRLSERLLLLETAERVRSRIRVEEWRGLLSEELECSATGLTRAVENVAEWARGHLRSVVLYTGFVRPLKEYLERTGFTLKPVYLQHYRRPQLDALRIMMWVHGVDKISDDIVARCVKAQLRYLDYVLSSKDIDVAHERWTLETSHIHMYSCWE